MQSALADVASPFTSSSTRAPSNERLRNMYPTFPMFVFAIHNRRYGKPPSGKWHARKALCLTFPSQREYFPRRPGSKGNGLPRKPTPRSPKSPSNCLVPKRGRCSKALPSESCQRLLCWCSPLNDARPARATNQSEIRIEEKISGSPRAKARCDQGRGNLCGKLRHRLIAGSGAANLARVRFGS